MEGFETGANDAVFAEQQEPTSTIETDSTSAGAENTAASQHTEQPKEVRHNYAAARRQAEAQLNEYRSRADSYAKANGYNSFEEMERASRDERLQQVGLDSNLLDPMIADALNAHPVFKAMQQAEMNNIVDQQLREFKAEYPDAGVSSVEDFAKLPHYDKFYDYVSKGLTYQEAYELSHRAELNTKRTAAAKQSVRNAANGKSHLQAETGKGALESPVEAPADVRDMYRQMLGWDDAKINKHYAKLNK